MCDVVDINIEFLYDCIYSAWCLGFVDEYNMIAFMLKVFAALNRNPAAPGVLILQENILPLDETKEW